MSRGEGSCGFTLPETLAALVLVAVVLPVALRVVSLSAGVGSVAADRAMAVQLAESKLAELTTADQWQDAVLQGDFSATATASTATPTSPDSAVDDYRWSVELTDWADLSLQQLSVTVTWDHRGREQSVRLTTLVSEQQP